MRVRFRVTLGVRLVAVLGVLVVRYGDPDLSRGEGANSGWDYRCSKSTCKWAHSYDTEPSAPRCQRCGARMEPAPLSDSGG
ncbi:hypothetical protein [Streptomyces sp. NBC_00019]|uniref:hypothetical protein n=1 Tax=Streptomyces sp. NBC_00019 TaxID=2975623 RepID=UPI0032489294